MLLKNYYFLRNKVRETCIYKKTKYYLLQEALAAVFAVTAVLSLVLLLAQNPSTKEYLLSQKFIIEIFLAPGFLLIIMFISAVSLLVLIILSNNKKYNNWISKFESERNDSIKGLINESLEGEKDIDSALLFLSDNFKIDFDEYYAVINRKYTVVLMSSLVTAITSLIGNFIDAILFMNQEGHSLNTVAVISSVVVIIIVVVLEFRNELSRLFNGGYRLDNLRIAYCLCKDPSNFITLKQRSRRRDDKKHKHQRLGRRVRV